MKEAIEALEKALADARVQHKIWDETRDKRLAEYREAEKRVYDYAGRMDRFEAAIAVLKASEKPAPGPINLPRQKLGVVCSSCSEPWEEGHRCQPETLSVAVPPKCAHCGTAHWPTELCDGSVKPAADQPDLANAAETKPCSDCGGIHAEVLCPWEARPSSKRPRIFGDVPGA